MDHIAIDLGARKSQICRRRADGEIVEERRVPTTALGAFLRGVEPSRVIVETATGAFRIASVAKGAGHTVVVVPSTMARSLGVGARKMKSDVRDARLLSEMSCLRATLPSVHQPSAESRRIKSQLAMREQQVGARTMLINGVRAWMRDESEPLSAGQAEAVPRRVRKWATDKKRTLPVEVERQLALIEALTTSIDAANEELEAVAAADEVCQKLETVPGVGALTALCFKATLDDRTRFQTAHQVQSYLGLTPGENSSGERERKTSITKAGSPRMRKLLVQAAWTLRRCAASHPLVLWAQEVEKRRGKRIAVVALARKLAGILFALWRDGAVYNPTRTAAPLATRSDGDEAMKATLALLSSPNRP